MHSRSRLIRNGMMAVLAGSTAGTAVGLWSVRHWTPNVTVAVPMPAVGAKSSSASAGTGDANAGLARRELRPVDASAASVPVPTKHSARSTSAPHAQHPVPAGDAGQDLLQRARVLAERSDVPALLELRDDASRRAAER